MYLSTIRFITFFQMNELTEDNFLGFFSKIFFGKKKFASKHCAFISATNTNFITRKKNGFFLTGFLKKKVS